MLPIACVDHHIHGRTRLLLLSRRRNAAWFERAEGELRACRGVDGAEGNPTTGSLLVFHTLSLEELGLQAAARGLFELRLEPPAGPLSQRLAGDVRGGIRRLDGWLSASSQGGVDLAAVAFLALAAAGAVQVFRGKALPAGVSLLRYALQILPVAAGRPAGPASP